MEEKDWQTRVTPANQDDRRYFREKCFNEDIAMSVVLGKLIEKYLSGEVKLTSNTQSLV